MYHRIGVPQRGLNLLGNIDGLFGGFGGFIAPVGNHADPVSGFVPALDIVETADGFEVAVDLPGVKKDNLSVTIKDNVLTIEAESPSASTPNDRDTVIKSERRVGRQYRALRLGKAVDEGKVRADYNDGVLRLSLPRSAKLKPRKIAVDVH